MTTIRLIRKKDCKHSVVYEALGDADPPIRSVYLMRSFSPSMPEAIELTLRAIEPTTDNTRQG